MITDADTLQSAVGAIRTLDELKVIRISATIREKPEWRRKINDESVVSKWREEACAQDVTESMFDFLLAELHWFADQYDPETGIDHAIIPGVFLSDVLILLGDRDSLRHGANALAAVPEIQKDWHPNSEGQVLDLVHPSLYPYVRKRTPRLFAPQDPPQPAHATAGPSESSVSTDMDAVASSILRLIYFDPPLHYFPSPAAALAAAGHGTPTSAPTYRADIVQQIHRTEYQWLPVDVEVPADLALNARFLSYINNLHPSPDRPGGILYPVLERIFTKFVPLFERTLTESRRRGNGNEGIRAEFLAAPSEDYWDPPQPDFESYDELGASDSDLDPDELFDEWRNKCIFVRPVVKPFTPPESPGPAQVTLRGRTVQVIIKMANVHLTPEKPEYAGGSWHVEGTNTECIVATGIYYFESENIADPSLSFRQAAKVPEYYQDQYEHLEYLYGIQQVWGHAIQYLGATAIPEGRCICFPNGLQHRLSFKLIDPTKPGHRKILVFFLVNPSRRILSTSDVPPQQLEWFLDEIRLQAGTRLSTLPPELFEIICKYVRAIAHAEADTLAWLMSLSEAKEHRLKLMEQRAAFVKSVNEEL